MTKNNLSSSLPGLLLGCTSQFSHCCSSHSCWISLTRSLGAHWKCGVQVDSGNEWWRWGDVNKLHRSYCMQCATTVSMVTLFVHKSSDRGSVLRQCSPAHHTFSCTDHWLFKIATPGACSYWRNIPWSCQETKSEQSTKVHRNGSSEAEGRKWVTRHWSTGGLPNTL